MTRLLIVIPTLNEAAHIAALAEVIGENLGGWL